ncbi:MAG TPA: aminotransferase class V-fold PLP-dependent enzyme [Candidatus Sulfotelmatobacter sp.]|nr:aminotransferase class V-fold PLP-dependent enzyme [Candidatus Sulfotelmatobacter sp.]
MSTTESAEFSAPIDFYPYRDRFRSYRRLDPEPRSRESILEELRTMAEEEDRPADGGRVSGSIYHGGHDHYRFLTEAYGLFAHANVLQRDMYPSATKLEAEIVAMTASLLHGEAVATHHPADEVCGVVTFGGTESLINPMLVYRERGRVEKGITHPEVIVPVTAHVALQKAAHLLGITLITAPVRDDWLADVDWMRDHVTSNTVALVGSAGNYPHGLIDPIDELSEIALEHDLGLHVDACMGGFILPWGERLGYPIPRFDFRVPGVTSISADTHKFGYALKGTSVLLYRNLQLRRYQYFNYPDWPGGIYLSPGLSGSRSGGVVAATWAAMVSLGERGYLESAERIFRTAATMRAGIEAIPELRVFGDPYFIIAFHSPSLDVYHINDHLITSGWRLNALQRPPGLHFCVTRPNTQPGVVEAFLRDLRAAVAYAQRPDLGQPRSGALYGLGAMPGGDEILETLSAAAVDAMYAVAPGGRES